MYVCVYVCVCMYVQHDAAYSSSSQSSSLLLSSPGLCDVVPEPSATTVAPVLRLPRRPSLYLPSNADSPSSTGSTGSPAGASSFAHTYGSGSGSGPVKVTPLGLTQKLALAEAIGSANSPASVASYDSPASESGRTTPRNTRSPSFRRLSEALQFSGDATV